MTSTSVGTTTRGRASLSTLAVALLISTAASSGCGGVSDPAPPIVKVYPVKGKVLLADGTPLKGGHVWFVPTKDSVLNSYGEISTDGSFSLNTGSSGEGAPEGEFKVRIEPAEPVAPVARGTRRTGKGLSFPEKYSDEDASKITVTIKAGSNDLEPFRLR